MTAKNPLQRAIRVFAATTVVLYLVVIGLFVGGLVFTSRQLDENGKARAALCALHHDLERRAATTLAFVKDNPEGIAGISAADLRRSAQGQLQTARLLQDQLGNCG